MNRLDRDEIRMHVPAEAGALYNLVSDVTRTPEWSPAVVSCAWLDGAVSAAAGARFTARNRRRWLTWSNQQVVAVASRGSEFSVIRTERGGGSVRWSYRLEQAGAGTCVVLGYQVLRASAGRAARALAAAVRRPRPAGRPARQHGHQPEPTRRSRPPGELRQPARPRFSARPGSY